MDKEKFDTYEELVNKYSKAFYSHVKKLFSLEDLKQETWLCLLSLDKELKNDPRLRDRPFLVVVIRNNLINLIKREIRLKQILTEEYDTVEDLIANESESSPEEAIIGIEQLDILSGKVSHVENGEFVLSQTINGYSTREIAEIANRQGIKLSKSGVNRIQHKLREEAARIILK